MVHPVMSKAKALIAEDEPVLREGLRTMLAAVWPELDIVALTGDGAEAMDLVERYRPDVLFLDIEMPGASGLDVAQAASGRCHVVFITAYDRYAVAAFEEGAVDYVMKPFDIARLTAACKRLRERLDTQPANLDRLLERLLALAARNRAYLRWINVESHGKVRLLTVEEVCYFHSDLKYTRVVTADSDALIRTPLKELLDELDPAAFRQIHRSTIVNLNAIAEVARDFRGRPFLRLRNRRETLPISQPFAHLFRQM
jgi:DNA-binding LytR/AlgR family response regulator